MSLSRTRRKELDKLRGNAEKLWEHQQSVLDHATSLAREASRQAGLLTREEVTPRVRDSYEHYLRPGVDTARDVVSGVGDSIERNVLPAMGNALGAVLSIGDIAKDARVRNAINRLQGKKAIVAKKSPGFGTYVAIGAGVLAALAVAYAVWQTFRADDELWVTEDDIDAVN